MLRLRRSTNSPFLALLGGMGLAIALAPAVLAGNPNKGDVWVDNVGQPAGPGHEMDPHLACADINLWGAALADPAGTFTIDGWQPSGTGAGDQAWPGTQASPALAPWTYSVAHGNQVIAVVNVQTLLAHAHTNGDTPQAQQGYHFKLQFSQDPQKHKTFWVDCPVTPVPLPSPHSSPTPRSTPSAGASPTPTPGTTPSPGGDASPTPSANPSPSGSPSTSSSPEPSPTTTVAGATTHGGGGVTGGTANADGQGGVAGSSFHGGVLGISINMPLTGRRVPVFGLALALAMMMAGMALWAWQYRGRPVPLSADR